MSTRTLPIVILGATLCLGAAGAPAASGGAGLQGHEPPAPYRPVLDEPHELRLIVPPRDGRLARNADGEAGSMRFYGGVRFSRASRRKRIARVRVSLLTDRGRLLARITLRNDGRRRWRYVHLDAGETRRDRYVLRYAMIYERRVRPTFRRDHRIRVHAP